MGLPDLFVFLVLLAISAGDGFRALISEQNRIYTYSLSTNVSCGTTTPVQKQSSWSLQANLYVQTYDDFGRLWVKLGNIKSQTHTKEGISSTENKELEKYLEEPFEIGICFSSIHIQDEPVWVTNVKRAIAVNFLVAELNWSMSTIEEPCLYGSCLSVYQRLGNRVRKYYAGSNLRNGPTMYERRCDSPRLVDDWRLPSQFRPDPNYVMTAERDYYLDDRIGLMKMKLKSEFQYKTHDHIILKVETDLSLKYEESTPAQTIQKLNLTESSLQYAFHNYSDPSNGIWNTDQDLIREKTYQLLLKIAQKGIDSDNIVRNASFIHNLDFIDLLSLMSQLDFPSLKRLFISVLGTSYELETSRNIYLEVLPYVRTEAGARLIHHLVTKQKEKIEDAMLVSLIRKLPYSIVTYNKQLVQDLEVFTKLGPDWSQEIRHAGILSFATLVSKAMDAEFDQEYFDDIYDKYLRMYNYCPQYIDRLVWLQGMTNIGKNVVKYLDEIYTDNKKVRHERLWAALASLDIWKSSSLSNTLPILMNETEHIQLRVIALHAILRSPLGPRDFLNVNNYIKASENKRLKRFWYSTMKSLERNRFYEKYKSTSYYIPFLAAQLEDPGWDQWATNNYIISQEPSLDVQGPSFQLLTVGGSHSGPPELIIVEFSTGGEMSFNGAFYITAEGVSTNIFRRLTKVNDAGDVPKEFQNIIDQLKAGAKDEKVHIDIILKIYGKTVYATHIDQEKFDTWNAEDLRKSIEDFVRYGSHINQQIVYYPTQMVKYFPTEIGTPVRVYSTIVSFTSVRGNITAPSTDDLTWRNDLHLRYQGTAVTSLSTDGPLGPSEHAVRIQQSMVLHLPTKFDIRMVPANRTIELKWTNPAQNGGIAMHSRTQVETVKQNKTDTETITVKRKLQEDKGIFFDCENPMHPSQISERLTTRNQHNILASLQLSHIILNSIGLISVPTSGSCGIILPPFQLKPGSQVRLYFKVDEFQLHFMSTALRFAFASDYHEESEGDRTNQLSTKGSLNITMRENTLKLNTGITVFPFEKGLSNFSYCLDGSLTNISPSNTDFTDNLASYTGVLNAYHSSSDCINKLNSTSEITVEFKNIAKTQTSREFSVSVKGNDVPSLGLEALNVLGYLDPYVQLDKRSNRDFEKYIRLIEDKEGIWLSLTEGDNNLTKLRDNTWLPPKHTVTQFMRKLGLYHECQLNETFNPQADVLVIGDCAQNPRFSLQIGPERVATGYFEERRFHLKSSLPRAPFEEEIKKITDIRIYRNSQNITSILILQPYMAYACGLCI